MYLEQIQEANDIQKLEGGELEDLAQEIRDFLIEKISMTGGHLASNLGVVELTMAMHRSFHLPEDKMIWDVGHQAYTHKLLTGRKSGFDDLRKYGGMSGFPKRKESDCDAFDTGHSSTSFSAGLGYVEARDIKGEDYSVLSVIGDGSMTGVSGISSIAEFSGAVISGISSDSYASSTISLSRIFSEALRISSSFEISISIFFVSVSDF